MIRKNFFFLTLFLLFVGFLHSQENQVIQVKIEGAEKLKTSFVNKILTTKKYQKLDSIKLENDLIFLI